MKTTTYVLIVSTKYPAYHPRKGEPTYFAHKLFRGVKNALWGDCLSCYRTKSCKYIMDCKVYGNKIHTIRKNFPLWEKRMKKILAGEAVISVRYWMLPGGCYTKGNKQIEVCRLGKDDGVGIQKVEWEEMIMVASERAFISNDEVYTPLIKETKAAPTIETLAKNDGLSLQDFKDWFKGYDLSKPMVVLHLTNFRY